MPLKGETEKKKSEFVDLVNSDLRVDVEDLRMVLSSKMGILTSMWLTAIGMILTITVALFALPNTPDTALYAKSASTIVVALLFLRVLRAPDPVQRLERILKDTDYLDAKEIAEKRKRAVR